MDIIYSVQTCVAHWAKGGEYECRSIVSPPHCRPTEPDCISLLSTAYQTLVHATLMTWSSKHSLTAATLVRFIQTVLNGLPSSSTPPGKSSNTRLFGEILLDLIWAVDTELDEILADTRGIAMVEQGKDDKLMEGNDVPESVSKIISAKQNAEKDKVVLVDIVRKLLHAGILELISCRERLDMSLLTNVGLIPDRAAFEKKEVRTRTALFYKQNKFNLLREQSEGYTKLSTDLVSTLGPPHSSVTGYPIESASAVESRARSAWQRVVSLIGYFDLDPNRALDVILDVFSTNLSSHHQFFLALLSCSPWAGESKIMRRDAQEMTTEPDPEQYRGKTMDEILILVECGSQSDQCSPISSMEKEAKVLAQVLGFKFDHYQSADVTEVCPRSLYLMAALLIRNYFITLEDLWPHLSLPDEEMPSVYKKYAAAVQSRVKSSATNLLAMAAPLESHGSSKRAAAAVTETKSLLEVKEPPNQKAMLLVALLSVGALRPAFSILTMFPWLVDTQREVADLLLQIMKVSLSPVYDAMFNKKEGNDSFMQPKSRYSIGGVVPPAPRKPQLTLCAPTPPNTHVHEFVFFFPQWTDRVPLCSTMEDLIDVIEPVMKFTGLHISREPLFLTKFLRIGKVHLSSAIPLDTEANKSPVVLEPDHPTHHFWLKVVRLYLLPALSMLPGNAVCTVEVWNIVKQFETTIRWRLYGEWRDVTYKSHPELKAQLILRERETKGILRRLSSQTIESLAGPVAKLAHSNPCIFFSNAVSQIQAYENLSDVVIQALRYATNMGFDILVFVVLDSLANPEKERVKDDGVFSSDWLQNLATFIGALFRRYSSDLTPLLKYIVHQLYAGQTSEIIVLEKLILKMAGIEPLPTLSDTQITAMAGGPTLRIEAVASEIRGAAFDVSESALKGAPRLGKALIDSKLAFPLVIQVAQQRQACVFRTKDAHLKSIAYLYDATHGVLFQYLDLLTTTSAVSLEEYRSFLPSMADFNKDYGICSPLTMHIMRPLFNDAILTHALDWKTKQDAAKAEAAEAQERRLKAALAAKREPSTVSSEGISSSPPLPTEESSALVQTGSSDVTMASGNQDESQGSQANQLPWITELHALFNDCKAMAPSNACDVLGPGFYLSFWQMSSYDIYFPKERYEETERLLRANSEVCHGKYRQAERSLEKALRQTALMHRNQRERYLSTASELRTEKEMQEAVYRFTTDIGGRLDREKMHWFAHVPGRVKLQALVSSLIEHCIQPRCLLSPMDADFCARIVQVMHLRGTPGFPSLLCYDKILGEHVKVIIFSCTENEARNYGRFLKGVLRDLYRWHKDEKAFEGSIRRKNGSKVILLPGFQKRWSHEGPASADDLLSWADFKSFLKKCHRKLGKCFTECIEAGDFMHVYNAVLVLKEIIEFFPIASVNEVVGSLIDLEIQRLAQSEERGDLKILARAYSSSLKKREEIWAMPKAAQTHVAKASSSTSSNSKASTPQPNAQEQVRESPKAPAASQGLEKDAKLPSGPRIALVGKSPAPSAERPSPTPDRFVATKLALESIPRPEVVKRVRPDSKSTDTADTEAIRKEASFPTDAMQVDQVPDNDDTSRKVGERHGSQTVSGASRSTAAHPRRSVAQSSVTEAPGSSVLSQETRAQDLAQAKSMPPPSDQVHAQERHQGSGAPIDIMKDVQDVGSPDMRTSSPITTRPGTRNPSLDSRASVERTRSDRGDVDALEDRRSGRGNQSRSERGERNGHRTRSDRGPRERTHGDDGDREKEDRDRDRRRDRDKDRHSDKDRERDRDRGKERDRDRDRHRRDERDRDRESSRKDRDQTSSRGTTSAAPRETVQGDHGLPTRPDATRSHRGSVTEDSATKRRRQVEEESERSSKRGSRTHRSDERSRRPSEKESRDHPRDDRRRRDRDGEEPEAKASDKPTDSRGSRFNSENASSPKSSAPPPSAPRAMASGPAINPRLSGGGRSEVGPNRGDREWKGPGGYNQRGSAVSSPVVTSSPVLPVSSGSLRARISDKEPMQMPSGLGNGPQRPMNGNDRRQHSPEMLSDTKKRTMTDRETDKDDVAGHVDPTTQPPKRPRILRNRYESGAGLARRILPIADRSDNGGKIDRS